MEKSKGGEGSILPWQEDESLEDIKRKQEEEFGFHPKMFGQRSHPNNDKEKKTTNSEKGRNYIILIPKVWD